MIKPYGNRIAVRPEAMKEVSDGGLLLPGNRGQITQMGIVAAAGPGRTNSEGQTIPMKIKEGAKILFEKFAGVPVVEDGEKYLLMYEQDIIAEII